MTTIVFDGKTLAADKRLSYGSTPVDGLMPKVFPVTDHKNWQVIALAGRMSAATRLMAYVLEGGDRPTDIDESVGLLAIDIAGVPYQIGGDGIPTRVPMKWAIGSGQDYALGALEVGADAETALKAATKLDMSTGGGVDLYQVSIK